jgi:hypothetical protein
VGDGTMMTRSAKEIERTAITEIALLIEEFGELFASRIVDNNTGVLDAIEDDWVKLRQSTEKVYQQMVSELTDSVDERDMIAKKTRME